MTSNEVPDSVTALSELVKIPSPSGSEEKAVDYLVNLMAGLGLDAHKDKDGNAVGSTKGSGPHILLVGHIDTVEGDLPVNADGESLTGRGTVDAKGPLMAMVFAAVQFKGRQDINITVIGAVDEEGDSRGARSLKDQYQPDFIIIGEPSGWDGICIGYKGHMRATYKVSCPHVHRAHPRANAIEVALQYYAELQTLCGSRDYFNQEPMFDTLTVAPRDIIINRDEYNVTVELFLDFRIPNNYDIAGLENSLNSNLNGGEITIHHQDPPVLVDKNNRLVRSLLASIRNNDGDPRFKKKTGTSDMNILAQYWSVPIVSYGPGDSSLDHTSEEQIIISEYQRSIKVLTEALETLAQAASK
jgi:LysW-gamma-L-lysine carboxypeptidase